MPLGYEARVEPGGQFALVGGSAGAIVTDEHRSHAATLSLDGRLRVYDLKTGEVAVSRALAGDETAAPGLVAVAGVPGQQLLGAATRDGRVVAQPVEWDVSFVEERRRVDARFPDPLLFELDLGGAPVGPFAVQVTAGGTATAAGRLQDGSLAVVRRKLEKNPFTGESHESWTRETTAAPAGLSVLLLDAAQHNLFGGAASGELYWWRLGAGGLEAADVDAGETAAVTALTLLIGDRSLVVGRADGSIALWFPVGQQHSGVRLSRIRAFPSHGAAVRHLAPSLRNKSFVAQDDSGQLGLYHSTSSRTLWRGRSPVDAASALFFAPKADGAFIVSAGSIAELEIANPHPEVSLRAWFGKVWYEGYAEPGYAWQSTGGTDDFEPKLSLVPLIVGTLKGTIYSLLLAIPLGVFAALYTSHFMHPRLRGWVKPTVEIMAALPSVVLGFLAGLWLAPRLDRVVPALILMLVVLPALVIAAGLLWRAVPLALRRRFPAGAEIVPYMLVLAGGVALCLALNSSFASLAFGGDFPRWLLEVAGLRYDQRNALVVGLAMGFAVIPIIFSITEDAFSNVPKNLVSGSLALGATPWQTAIHVLLPTASPGIFSAIMVGFGRAIGETMIVLMATGNTPVLDWSPFTGFRTLSANIAVEIPEAPQGGTLYRTLFLSALLLFVFTFLINTVAEIVRQRLRRRYAEI